jgi:hypothetical protein
VTLFPEATRFTEYYVFGLSPAFVGLLLALPFVVRTLSRPATYLLLFGLGVYGFWFFLMQQTRYFVPALPAYALLSALVVSTVWERRGIARLGAVALAAGSALWGVVLAGGIAFWGVEGVQGETQSRPAFPFVAGTEKRDEYLTRRLGGLYDVSQWVNQKTSQNAKVALLGEPRGFYLDRPYAWAEPDHAEGYILQAWDTYTTGAQMVGDIKAKGYTFLLVGPELGADQPNYTPPKWRVLLSEAVRSDTVMPVYENRGYMVYEVR